MRRLGGEQLRRTGGGERAALTRARRLWWRTRDYAYVVRRQVVGGLGRGGPDAYRAPARVSPNPGTPDRVGPDVLLVPGVYESWRFLQPLAVMLNRHGYRVHVLPALGRNRVPVAAGAALLGQYLDEHDLHGVVVVAHSKGGLIGKLAMLDPDPPDRIRSMVAVNAPFGGSALARWVPLAAVRALVPTDATLLALAEERAVNARIASVYSWWDPHIPGGSRLDGAVNIELSTPGHFRSLTDPDLERVVLDAVRAAVPGRG